MIQVLQAIQKLLVIGIPKLGSRKFCVWIIATIGLFMQLLTPDQWMMIAMLYTGAETMLDWKTAPQATNALQQLSTGTNQ